MFDGLGGAIVGALVGGLVSLWIATLVLDRTRRDNDDLAREQASLDAARQLSLGLHRLTTDLADLRSLPDANGQQAIDNAARWFELEIINQAPALRDPNLRHSVERVHNVLRNFNHFAFKSGAITDGWTHGRFRVIADIQRADYISFVRDALTAYRCGELVELPKSPGWRRHHGAWWWRIPPGMYVDESGTPDPGWELGSVDGAEYWVHPGGRAQPSISGTSPDP